MAQLQINPDILTDVYKGKFLQAVEENCLLTAGISQLQDEIAKLQETNQTLQAEVDRFVIDSGRGDGVPTTE